MKKIFSNKNTWIVLGIIALFLIWWGISLIFDQNSMIFPSPISAFKAMIELLKNKVTYVYLGYTLLKMLIGFAFSFLFALILGISAGHNSKIYHFLSPIMTVLKSVPTVAVVYLFIVIVQPAYSPVYVVVFICLPILYEAIVRGIKNTDKNIIKASKIDGANRVREIFYIRLPLAIPYIAVGISSSLALSFKLEIMAEVLTGMTKNGIGAAIGALQGLDANLDRVFGYTFIIIIIVLIFSFISNAVKSHFSKLVSFN